MSISRTRTAAVIGVQGYLVDVEAAVTGGVPGLHLYGLPDTSLGETRDRVRAAIFNSGETWPNRHVTVSLFPASLPKHGWLEKIGLPYDELHCSFDKIARCRELEIDVLIDDSPVNLLNAGDAGITPATILHPWNRDLCEEEDIVCASDWPTLARLLEPVLA